MRIKPRHDVKNEFLRRGRGVFALAATLTMAGWTQGVAAGEVPTHPFYLGADVSFLDASGRGGRERVYRENGQTNEEWRILLEHGWKAFRLRVFVSPVREAPDNSLENTIPLAKRIKDAGALLFLDLHFSDTWADPGHQEIPVAWRNLDFNGLEGAWEAHGSNVVRKLKEAGAMPDWVQVGNEITAGAAWPLAKLQASTPAEEARQWDHLTRLLKAGIRGVKSGAGGAPVRIAIHIDQGAHWTATQWFFDHLQRAGVDYDIIAQSFYPPWRHGTLEQLLDNMHHCAARYGKDFLVAETGYDQSHYPTNDCMLWPVTPSGRLQFMVDLVNTVRKAPRGLGVMYWAPEWDLWNADGSPGPAVFVMDKLTTLTNRPASHAPELKPGP